MSGPMTPRRKYGLSAAPFVAVIATTTVACIFEEGNYNLGGRRTENTGRVDPNEQDETCIQGNCDQICGTQLGGAIVAENCTCIGGKCRQQCGQGSTCTCSAGRCSQKCDAKTRCTCSGGGCTQDCQADTSLCTCGGGGCQCTGPGCK